MNKVPYFLSIVMLMPLLSLNAFAGGAVARSLTQAAPIQVLKTCTVTTTQAQPTTYLVKVVEMQGSAMGINDPFFDPVGMAIIFESDSMSSSEIGSYTLNLRGGPSLSPGQDHYAGVTAGTLLDLRINFTQAGITMSMPGAGRLEFVGDDGKKVVLSSAPVAGETAATFSCQ